VNPRWWRIAIVYEDAGEPWTWTFHVRAFTETSARALVGERVDHDFVVYGCHPSEPLPTAPRDEEIAADYGPWRRSWDDPTVAPLRERLREDAEGAEGSREGR
jgi:hypothetical protein